MDLFDSLLNNEVKEFFHDYEEKFQKLIKQKFQKFNFNYYYFNLKSLRNYAENIVMTKTFDNIEYDIAVFLKNNPRINEEIMNKNLNMLGEIAEEKMEIEEGAVNLQNIFKFYKPEPRSKSNQRSTPEPISKSNQRSIPEPRSKSNQRSTPEPTSKSNQRSNQRSNQNSLTRSRKRTRKNR